jgi:hypothetical protein
MMNRIQIEQELLGSEILCISPPPAFTDPQGMKPLMGNAAANSPACHVRKADANLLN